MPNPIAVAIRGKGISPMLSRVVSIANRYGVTSAKIDRSISQFISTLKQNYCQATIPITADALFRNQDIARKYQAQGLELAIHGFSHVDYRLLSGNIQIDHIKQAQDIFQKAGIKAVGFRSPYLRWNENTLAALIACGFRYDSSQALDLGVVDIAQESSYFRALEFYRSQSISQYPALPRLEAGLVRIPYCLPDDEALIERLNKTNTEEIAEIWLSMLDRIYEAGGLFTLGLHPERAQLCQGALELVLKKAASLSPRVWIARLDEIATWYEMLSNATYDIQHLSNDRKYVQINTPPGATILARSVEVEAHTEPWICGYRCVVKNEFVILNSKRPIIGLSPISPPALLSFLQHQGFLVEISADAQSYPFYLERANFLPEDECPLLAEIENGEWPLLRLACWPGGARCTLAITGDVDAFTIWDYGRRIFNV